MIDLGVLLQWLGFVGLAWSYLLIFGERDD